MDKPNGPTRAKPAAPPERKPDSKKRSSTHEWYVDDGSGKAPEAFREEPARGPSATPSPPPPPAPAAWAPDTDERIRRAELAATQAAEQRATDEIYALEEDLEQAKREGAARAEALEAKLAEAEERVRVATGAVPPPTDAEAPGDPRARELEEQARNGAATWLRDQVRQIERSADERVRKAEAAQAEAEKRLEEEVAKARAEAEGGRDERLGAGAATDLAPPEWVMRPPGEQASGDTPDEAEPEEEQPAPEPEPEAKP